VTHLVVDEQTALSLVEAMDAADASTS